jgi:uncharacterized protein YdhG (YjbR/CyaY superfamily)
MFDAVAVAARRSAEHATLGPMGEVTDYIATLDGDRRAAVEHVVARARELVPAAEEGMSYGMPALRYRDSPLVSAVVTKNHVGLFPFSPEVVDVVAPDLAGFRRTKGSISFQPDTPVPDDVLDRIVLLRRDEIDAMRAKRR